MAQPFFTIVIPTYSRPEQLSACLGSITRLDYPRDRFEVIVVDDNSPQSPQNIVESFNPIMAVKLISQSHAGPAAARNKGAAGANGDFLVFTDDDCLPQSGWLNAFARQFLLTPEDLIGGRTLNALRDNLCSAASQAVIDAVYLYFNTNDRALFFTSNNFAVPAKTFRRLGGFNEEFQTSEDREFCDRWIQNGGSLVYVSDAVCDHAHALQLGSFWRQHFGYGQGAFRFHRARRLRYGARIDPDLWFYWRLINYPMVTETGYRRLMTTALVCLSQLASTAGFIWEMLSHFKYASSKQSRNMGDVPGAG
jgi:GT2 family glycosyltransferase